jgi:large subunit ribosomal protein L2
MSNIANYEKPRIWRYQPIKQLTLPATSSGGRNNQGRIVTFHRGGGHKQRYRVIDFRRRFIGVPATVIRLERDTVRVHLWFY